MKTLPFRSRAIGLLALALLLPRAFAGAGGEPVITGVRPEGTNLLVTLRLPAELRRVTLESRPRVGPGAWLPRRVHWNAGGSNDVTLSVPITAEMEVLRARGETEADLPLPASFYTGRADFTPTVSTSAVAPAGPMDTAFGNNLGTPETRGNDASGNPRAVVESDIWQIDGTTLYFFNNARGLQVIDLSTPDSPVLRGTLAFAAQGEQMYLLPGGSDNDRWLALLTSVSCDSSRGEVLLVRVRAGVPEIAGRLPFDGQVRESRLVGTALYLASYRWRAVPTSTNDPASGITWHSETAIASFDLADPNRPVARPERVIDATPQAIQATDRFLFVATTGPANGTDDPSQPVWLRPGVNGVTVFDISDPAGLVEQRASLVVKGRVQDKFKMHLRDDVLTVVTLRDTEWRMVTRTNWVVRETGPNGERLDPPVREAIVYNAFEQVAPSQTWLETFSLANPAQPAALGQLRIIENESLFATRFVNDRAYVVTFRQIDPLWIIDLSNPATPVIRGELQIPGYSSYLEPIGSSRLLAVGVEGGNATVALFDVSDEARPTQLSKVFLGSGWSWSEANSDEKAFKYLPETGLVLVPWQGYEDKQFVQAMQLVDLQGDRLVKRGIIPHQLQARRATTLANRIVSLSGEELLVVDHSDRDHPRVTADLDLSFHVSRVRVHGDRLVLLSRTAASIPTLRRVTAQAPEQILGSLVLPDFPVVGFERLGDRLHLLQFEGDTYRTEPLLVTNVAGSSSTVVTNWIQITVPGDIVAREIGFNGDQPVLQGESRARRPDGYYGAFLRGLDAGPGLMLWVDGDASDLPFYRGIDSIILGEPAIGIGWRGGWWWGPRSLSVVAVDVSTPGQPAIRSRFTLGNSEPYRGFSRAHAADGRLYVSHREVVMRQESKEDASTGPGGIPLLPIIDPGWLSETRHMLDVVDFANPAEPLVRPPVPLPGELRGIAHRGAMLFASGSTTNTPADRSELWALAYDGVAARLVDTALPHAAASFHVTPAGHVLASRPAPTNTEPATVEVWSIGSDGRWTAPGSISVPGDHATLQPVGSIVLSQAASGIAFLRPTGSGAALIGVAAPVCGFWGDASAGDSEDGGAIWLPLYSGRLVRIEPAPGLQTP